MPQPLKAKTLMSVSAACEGSTYQLEIQDEARNRALFELSAKQAPRLADQLDNLIADEEEEPGLAVRQPQPAPAVQGSLAVVTWYDTTKGSGFMMPDAEGDEVFVHRTILEQAGLSQLERRASAFRSWKAVRVLRSAGSRLRERQGGFLREVS